MEFKKAVRALLASLKDGGGPIKRKTALIKYGRRRDRVRRKKDTSRETASLSIMNRG